MNCLEITGNTKERVIKERTITKKIKSQFGENNKQHLMLAIVVQAIKDLSIKTVHFDDVGTAYGLMIAWSDIKNSPEWEDKSVKEKTPYRESRLNTMIRLSAKQYLSGTIEHAEWCGVESQWIRDIIIKINKTENIEALWAKARK